MNRNVASSTPPPPAAPVVAGAVPVAGSEEELARGRRDLFWVLLGCVPLALTFFWFDKNPASLSWLSRIGRPALGNAVSSLELLLCLNLVHRGRNDLRQLWGGTQRAVPDALAALVLGGLLFVVWWIVFHLLYQGTIPHILPRAGGKSSISPADWIIFSLTTAIAAGATGLTIYGVVLKQLIALLRSRVLAIVVAASIATLVWNLAATLPQLGAELIRQILLATAVVYAGRVWPVSLASATCTVLIWVRFDSP